MSIGKYSPTVSKAYRVNQNWWNENSGPEFDSGYDIDGYDRYGYNVDDIDRAGYTEDEYLSNGQWIDYGDSEEYEYPIYNIVLSNWGFKNGKPVEING